MPVCLCAREYESAAQAPDDGSDYDGGNECVAHFDQEQIARDTDQRGQARDQEGRPKQTGGKNSLPDTFARDPSPQPRDSIREQQASCNAEQVRRVPMNNLRQLRRGQSQGGHPKTAKKILRVPQHPDVPGGEAGEEHGEMSRSGGASAA